MTLIAGPQSGYLSIRVIIDMSSLLHRQLPRAAGEVLRGLHPGSQQLGTGLRKGSFPIEKLFLGGHCPNWDKFLDVRPPTPS